MLKLKTFYEFIKENIKTSIIYPLQSPGGTPVLFLKKKNSALKLYVDYRGLNHIIHKNRYLILLIIDLLDALKKARVYSKIDLRNAYHLVHIAKDNE